MSSPADIFSAMPLSSGIFLDAHFTAPWCVSARVDAGDCGRFVPEPDTIIAFHYIYQGRLNLEIDAWPAVEASAGDILILPRNDKHLMASAPGRAPVAAEQLIRPSAAGGLATIRHGGGGESTRMICGFLGCDRQYRPVLDLLPRVVKVTLPDPIAASWFDSSFKLVAREMIFHAHSATPSLARLTELLFIDAIQRAVRGKPQESVAWFRGQSDRRIMRALSLLQAQPRHHWSSEELARAVGMSRSAFAARFTELMGMPPRRYLTLQRLRLASARLLNGADSLAQIAFDIGYESEAAFSRAFKKEYGLPPATWREARRRPSG